MSNPVFDRSDPFGERRGRTATVAPFTAAAQVGDAATLERVYTAPAATPVQTGRLTYDDVIVRTGGLFLLLAATAAATWLLAPGLFGLGAIVGLVLGLVNAFKREPSPALIVAYTVAEGVFLGGISAFYESAYAGLVGQAVLATLAVFAVSLVAFRSGKVRVSAKSTRVLLVAMLGYLVFMLANGVLMLAGVGGGDFGPLRSGPLGVVVGLIAVGLAAYSLVVDFDSIKRGVERGAPARFAWTAAFGLMVTLIWLYLELLRLLAIFRN